MTKITYSIVAPIYNEIEIVDEFCKRIKDVMDSSGETWELVLVDEPTGSLDSENTRRILDLLFEYRDQKGTTMLVATHDDRVIRRADRTVTMRDGVIDAS